MKTKKSAVGPYRLMMTILYGKHKWIERSDGNIKMPNARIAAHSRTRSNKIREYLYLLQDWGFIQSLRWNPYWFSVVPVIPQGMALLVDPIIRSDVDPNIEPGEIIDV